MKEDGKEAPVPDEGQVGTSPQKTRKPRRCCCITMTVVLFILLALILTVVILFFTILKPKNPDAKLVSATVIGVSPRVSFSAMKIALNLTIELDLLIHNPNYASFRHGAGKGLILYAGNQVGEVDITPGTIPSRGSQTVSWHLTLQADEFLSSLSQIISDVGSGEFPFDAHTELPGRVNFLGFVKKHVVAVADCNIVVGISDLKVRQQVCKQKARL